MGQSKVMVWLSGILFLVLMTAISSSRLRSRFNAQAPAQAPAQSLPAAELPPVPPPPEASGAKEFPLPMAPAAAPVTLQPPVPAETQRPAPAEVPAPAAAAGVVDFGPQAGPCEADVAKLCPRLQPGTREFVKCLKTNWDDFSQACQRLRRGEPPDEGTEENQAVVCQADYMRFCTAHAPGTDEARACLLSHSAEVSDACQRALRHIPKARTQRE